MNLINISFQVEMMTLSNEKVNTLKEIFWAMNEVTFTKDVESHQETISKNLIFYRMGFFIWNKMPITSLIEVVSEVLKQKKDLHFCKSLLLLLGSNQRPSD